MRILPPVKPTPEQLPILADYKPGYLLVKGAAGSGKTTTALLRLNQLCATWLSRRNRLGLADPVRVLVLTYNRTLEGYIAALAAQQANAGDPNLDLEVTTFAKWAKSLLGNPTILDNQQQAALLKPLCRAFGGDVEFLVDEVDYVLSRFRPAKLQNYITTERTGRGAAPRMDSVRRQRLLDEVITPYLAKKTAAGAMDWNDVAVQAENAAPDEAWDIVIVDETQDFSANQIRAIKGHLADDFTVTFVMDAVQRIYPRYFTWSSVGITLNAIHTLKTNHRNTAQIAAFARPLVEGLPAEADGALPDAQSATRNGQVPILVSGTYSQQIEFMIDYIDQFIDLSAESVAFLKPKGGMWFDTVRAELSKTGIPNVTLTRVSRWPSGPERVALCTLHSAKGLEFDHVFMPGVNQKVTPHGPESGDAQLEGLRRLLAMGVGRAKDTLILGYKPAEASTLISLLDPATYELVKL